MTAEERRDGVRQLLAKLRTRSWYWLFRQADLKRGLGSPVVPRLRAATLDLNELEVVAAPDFPGMAADSELAVLLRAGDQGVLSVTTMCGHCQGSYCWHAAALLRTLTQTTAEPVVVDLVEGAEQERARSRESEGASPDSVFKRRRPVAAPVLEQEPEWPWQRVRPLLELRRVKAVVRELSERQLKPVAKTVEVGVALISVRYDGCPEAFPVAAGRVGPGVCRFQGAEGKWWRLRREAEAERSFLTELRMLGLQPVSLVLPDTKLEEGLHGALTVRLEEQALFWAGFREGCVASLKAAGWEVVVGPDFGYQIVAAEESGWFGSLEEEAESGQDWFALSLGFTVSERRISLVPVLARALDEGLTAEVLAEAATEKRRFRLVLDEPGDPVVEIPAARLLPLIDFLTELMTSMPLGRSGAAGQVTAEGKLRMDRLRAAQLTGLAGLPMQIPESLAALRDRLRAFDELRAPNIPNGLRAQLRPYQLDGVAWLQFLREFDLHGVLADDMGLGKTLQTITHLLIEKSAGRMETPSLVVAPTSVARNWVREIQKFAPELKVLLLHGAERRGLHRRISSHDVVVTTFPLLVRDMDRLKGTTWHLVALDEAQNIKNPLSQAAQCARLLKAKHRLCLTGTPMENHLGELWSLFEFLMPGFLGDSDSFRQMWRNPIEKKGDVERQTLLARRLRPLMLRRTKDSVAADLPSKTELVHRIAMHREQADLYETIRAMMDLRVREAIASQGMERSHIVVLDALMKLRQVCCHPLLLKLEAVRRVEESAKLDFLMEEMLPELLAEGRRVLIFSQFTQMLGLIERGLREKAIVYEKLTGSTEDRETPVRRFQEGKAAVFLISLKAGGSGLTLTAADTVIHFDPWWNPAAEAQASDRAHRIGQTKPVFIHKLICEGTIEEKILELQRQKAAMLEGLLSGQSGRLTLTQEDIQGLLKPMG